MSNITMNGMEYQPLNKSDDIRIVILQRGWVFVGRYAQVNENECVLTDAKNYRYQKSGQGFGYVAKYGPTPDCKLDPCELPVRFNPMTIIATLDCEGNKWSDTLK